MPATQDPAYRCFLPDLTELGIHLLAGKNNIITIETY